MAEGNLLGKHDVTLEIIREELREIAASERKCHRAAALNGNRVALGEATETERVGVESVTSLAQILKKKALSTEEYRCLQRAFIQSEENINSFLKVDNALFALVRDLSGNDTALRLSAASCCCNIALGNSKACTTLSKSAVPYLLAALNNSNDPLVDICVWTVGNLLNGSEKATEILYAQGIARHLLHLMRDCDDALLPSVMYATMHCVRAGFHRLRDFETVDLAEATVTRLARCNDTNANWLLALLSSRKECVGSLLNLVPSIVDSLYDAVTGESIDAVLRVTAALRLLANVAWDSSGQSADAFLNNPKYTTGDIRFLLNKLLSCQHIHVRKETLWFAGNLYNHPTAHVRKIMKDLVPLLPSFDDEATTLCRLAPIQID